MTKHKPLDDFMWIISKQSLTMPTQPPLIQIKYVMDAVLVTGMWYGVQGPLYKALLKEFNYEET